MNFSRFPCCNRQRIRAGFTLAELLVVIAIISLLVGLMVMGARGITGGTNRRAAIGMLMGIFDQARSVAISDGRSTYVVFVSTTRAQDGGGAVNPAMWGRACAIFEDPVLQDNTSAANYVPQRRSAWFYLPIGLAFKCAGNGDSTAISLTAVLPADRTPTADATVFNVIKTGGGTTSLSLPYVKFDAAGQIIDDKGNIVTPTVPPLHVLIFEGTASSAGVETFTHRAAIGTDGQKYALDEITLKPITGRARYTLNPYYNSVASN